MVKGANAFTCEARHMLILALEEIFQRRVSSVLLSGYTWQGLWDRNEPVCKQKCKKITLHKFRILQIWETWLRFGRLLKIYSMIKAPQNFSVRRSDRVKEDSKVHPSHVRLLDSG